MSEPSTGPITVKVEVNIPPALSPLAAMYRGAPGSVQRSVLRMGWGADANICKPAGGAATDVEIHLSGTVYSLAGFGLPTTGFTLPFGQIGDIPTSPPGGSSDIGTPQQEFEYEADHTWTMALSDTCSPTQEKDRTIVIWHKYENQAGDVYWMIEVIEAQIPLCGDIGAC